MQWHSFEPLAFPQVLSQAIYIPFSPPSFITSFLNGPIKQKFSPSLKSLNDHHVKNKSSNIIVFNIFIVIIIIATLVAKILVNFTFSTFRDLPVIIVYLFPQVACEFKNKTKP